MRTTISELVMALGLGLVVLVGISCISRMPMEKYTDPRWISAGAEVVQLIFMTYMMFWVWRLQHVLDRFLDVLTGNMDGVNPNLVSVVKMFVQKFVEETQRMQEEADERHNLGS